MVMDKVSECTYCGGTFPHQAPTGCNQPRPDIYWMLDEHVVIVVERQEIDGVVSFVVQDQEFEDHKCVITMNSRGRMLFDGHDVDTESFMAFVGMIDAVEDSPRKKVQFIGDTVVEV
jgi:hypothetical protein